MGPVFWAPNRAHFLSEKSSFRRFFSQSLGVFLADFELRRRSRRSRRSRLRRRSRVSRLRRLRHFSYQAFASWQWSNFLESRAPWNKKIIHINLDETSCRLCGETNKGAVAIGQTRSRKDALQGEHRASLSARRSAVTLVASVCDDTEIQRELPQIVIGSEKVVQQTVSHTLNADPFGRVYCLRQKSAWLNSRLMSTIIKLIGKTLEKFTSTHYFILNMDACPIHCTQEVARACNRAKLHLCLVPASMTGVMQVCDTHVFSQLKGFIRQGMERLRLDSVTGEATTLRVMQLLAEAVDHVVKKKIGKMRLSRMGFATNNKALAGLCEESCNWQKLHR